MQLCHIQGLSALRKVQRPVLLALKRLNKSGVGIAQIALCLAITVRSQEPLVFTTYAVGTECTSQIVKRQEVSPAVSIWSSWGISWLAGLAAAVAASHAE